MSDNEEVCSVCASSYTTVVRTKICCGYCSYHACKTCVGRYLLSQVVDAHCMSCRTGWNRDFIDSHLTKAFRTGAWRDHKKKIILNREKAVLPHFQKYAAAKKEMNRILPIKITITDQLEKAEAEKNNLHSRIQSCTYTISLIRTTADDPVHERLELDFKKLESTYRNFVSISIKYKKINNEYDEQINIYNDTTKKVVEKKEFIMKCVKDGCRGFLSQSYKCELCSVYVCKDCMVIKKEKNDDSHVCRKEDIDTVTLIRKDTKPCPKCGIRIIKSDGCNQMFCTSEGCATAFDWVTGKIISGTIHNPHYYEWLRRTNGSVPRANGDIPCGGLPQFYGAISTPMRTVGISKDYPKQAALISAIHACLADLEYVRLPQYIIVRDAMMFKELHVEFLLGNIDEEKWLQSMFIRENNLEKKSAVGLIIQTFYNAGADMLRNITTTLAEFVRLKVDPTYVINMKIIDTTLEQFENLRLYINSSLITTGESVNSPVPQFSDSWRWISPSSVAKIKEASKK